MARNRGRKARERRDFETAPLTHDEREALLDALLKPPLAISYALIGALAVEDELEQSIKARLKRLTDEEWKSILVDDEGPLGTFDRKIKFAHYLGILDASMKANLDIIRSIRNRFAHTKRLINFDHPFIAHELSKIQAPRGGKKRFTGSIKLSAKWEKCALLCLQCISQLSKNRFRGKQAAHKAWLKRHQKKFPMGSLFSALGSPYSLIPQSSVPSIPPPQPTSKNDGPNNPTPYGLLSGLLPYLDQKKD